MIDAGVPVKCMVSGVAMGLVDSSMGVASDDAIVLSDIAELEDFIGKMDFKVAGNETGISAVQLDVKNEGLTRNLFARALEQAKGNRLHILDEMKKHVTISENPELPPNVPRIVRVEVSADSKGKIIGPGGSNIRKLIEEFKLTNVNVTDDYCEISGTDASVLETVKMVILDICQGVGGGAGGGRGGFGNMNLPRLTMELPASGKGKLIGKGGQTINGLISEFGLSDIKINDETNEVDLIGGDDAARQECKNRIDALFDQGGSAPVGGRAPRGDDTSMPDKADDTIGIPKLRLGKVIGRGGCTIKGLIDEFGLSDMKARDARDESGEGIVELFGGTEDSRSECMERIRTMVGDEQVMPTAPKATSTPARPKISPKQPLTMPPRAAIGAKAAVLNKVQPVKAPIKPVASTAPITPKAQAPKGKAGTGIKVSEDLKMKMQMEFAEMCPGDTKNYRLLPHEVKLAKDLAAAFEMTIVGTGQNGEYIVTRPDDEGY